MLLPASSGAALKKGQGEVRRGKIATANRWKQFVTNMPGLLARRRKKQSSGERIVRELRREEEEEVAGADEEEEVVVVSEAPWKN